MRKYVDALLSFALGYIVGYGGIIIVVSTIVMLELIHQFFIFIAKLQYKKRFHAIERPDLAKKYGVKKFFVTKEKVVHGYAGMIIVPEDFDEKIVETAKEMAREHPPTSLKYRLIDYSLLLLGALVHAFIFVR